MWLILHLWLVLISVRISRWYENIHNTMFRWLMQSLFHLKNYKPESKTNSVCVKQEQEQRSEEETPLPSCSFAVGGGEGLTSCLPKEKEQWWKASSPILIYLSSLVCRIRDLHRHDCEEGDWSAAFSSPGRPLHKFGSITSIPELKNSWMHS